VLRISSTNITIKASASTSGSASTNTSTSASGSNSCVCGSLCCSRVGFGWHPGAAAQQASECCLERVAQPYLLLLLLLVGAAGLHG
jgi:hypothetical protein